MKRLAVATLERLHLAERARTIKHAYLAADHRRRMRRLFGQFVRPGDLSFDVGAHIGSRVQALRALGASVVAVEPQAECVTELERRFGSDSKVTIVAAALGAEPGEAELLVSDATELTSLSQQWIEAVTRSGRFGGRTWQRDARVAVTTLDQLVEDYGLPVFCKIDVEGFEAEVLDGLSRPIAVVGFEFTPEALDTAFLCIHRLQELARYEFRYSIGESMQLELDGWLGAEEFRDALEKLRGSRTFGDVYARQRED